MHTKLRAPQRNTNDLTRPLGKLPILAAVTHTRWLEHIQHIATSLDRDCYILDGTSQRNQITHSAAANHRAWFITDSDCAVPQPWKHIDLRTLPPIEAGGAFTLAAAIGAQDQPTIAVTNATGGAGASTLSLAIATACSAYNWDVTLFDAHPPSHRTFLAWGYLDEAECNRALDANLPGVQLRHHEPPGAPPEPVSSSAAAAWTAVPAQPAEACVFDLPREYIYEGATQHLAPTAFDLLVIVATQTLPSLFHANLLGNIARAEPDQHAVQSHRAQQNHHAQQSQRIIHVVREHHTGASTRQSPTHATVTDSTAPHILQDPGVLSLTYEHRIHAAQNTGQFVELLTSSAAASIDTDGGVLHTAHRILQRWFEQCATAAAVMRNEIGAPA